MIQMMALYKQSIYRYVYKDRSSGITFAFFIKQHTYLGKKKFHNYISKFASFSNNYFSKAPFPRAILY